MNPTDNDEAAVHYDLAIAYREMGLLQDAIAELLRGLAVVRTARREIALLYELGDAYQAGKERLRARYCFRRVARLEPGHGDPRGSVRERLRALGDSAPPDDVA